MSAKGISDADLANMRRWVTPDGRPPQNVDVIALIDRLDAAEREREAFAERVFRHGFSDGWTANQKGRLAASASVDEAWHFYVADGALQKSVALTANHSAPVVEERI